jgi:S-(hydroxymethyl)glutathione dehydrogenase/alcohol dehydrogenase
VVDVGPGVTTLKPGDHVIPLYTPECRECEYCLQPEDQPVPEAIRATQGQGLMPDGTSALLLDGKTDPALHGLLDLLQLHRAAGNRAGEDP